VSDNLGREPWLTAQAKQCSTIRPSGTGKCAVKVNKKGDSMQRCKLIVLSSTLAGRDDEPVDWHTDVHLVEVLQAPGIVSVQRFRRAEQQGVPGPYQWSYMAVYECETKDISQVIARLSARSDGESVRDSAALEAHYISCFEPITEVKRKPALVGGIADGGTRRSGEWNAHPALANTVRDSEPDSTQARLADIGSMRLEDWAGPVAGPTYLEENFQIPRSTLHRWQRRNQVIALRKGLGRHVFPLAQFVDGRPVPGIADVLALAKHPRLAWSWLVRPSPYLDGRIPIELLRQDLVSEVVLAARDLA
jgi:hypothetical protein